ncbi:MAG: NTP transferase domain-containing protein, partial [Mariniphaga sp.]|nr:NTP transferase domain-containing protein [Mariniphaga sp.]
SKYINKIIISTDSEEIGLVAKKYGAEVPFLRPEFLTKDSAKDIDIYIYTLERLKNEFGISINEFIVLQPTSPLRTSEDIDQAIELFRDRNADSVVSFCEVDHSPILAKKIINEKIIDFFNKSAEILNQKDEDKAFIPNGAIFIYNYQFLQKNGINYSDKTFPMMMSNEKSVHIDTLMDLEYAEFLISKNNNNLSGLNEVDRYKVISELTIRESIKKLDETGIGFIVVVDPSDQVIGVVTDGDFRRAVLTGISLDTPISVITNNSYLFIKEGYSKEELENVFLNDIAQVPVIKNGELKEIILRQNLPFISNENSKLHKLDIPVVIMAGGKGSRMEPFTHIMPKPLIPIGNKPIIEIIIDRFAEYGIHEFYLSLNYKANMIKAYFEELPIAKCLNYILEDSPLGTAGALKKLKNIIKSTFIVSNCDIIIKSDYTKIIDFHKNGKYDLTLVASMHHYTIPYGVCYVENGGDLKEMSEKPQYDYLINTGMYVLEPHVIDFIPENTFYHITHLIESLKKNNLKVGVYPVYEKSWIDVGQWEEYRNAIKNLQ